MREIEPWALVMLISFFCSLAATDGQKSLGYLQRTEHVYGQHLAVDVVIQRAKLLSRGAAGDAGIVQKYVDGRVAVFGGQRIDLGEIGHIQALDHQLVVSLSPALAALQRRMASDRSR